MLVETGRVRNSCYSSWDKEFYENIIHQVDVGE
jgi:hypothetical protein